MQRTATEVLADLQAVIAQSREGQFAGDATAKQTELVVELMGTTSFITIMLTVLPKAMPLVINIIKEVRSGKNFFEAILANLDQVIEVVLAVIGILSPSTPSNTTEKPNKIFPIIPR
jgi:predicted Kef-type K+ transport protein